MGVEDFLLGRKFLRTYQIFVDLTTRKIIVRAPSRPVWFHAHAQLRNESIAISVALAQDNILKPFERTILRAILLVDNVEPYIFGKFLINFHVPTRILKQAIFLEDTVATVGETGFFYVSLGNLTSNVQRIKRCTRGLSSQKIPEVAPEQQTEDKSAANFVYKVNEEMNIDTSSEF